MCGGIHYGEVEGLVSVERWSRSRGASCVVEYSTYVEVEICMFNVYRHQR